MTTNDKLKRFLKLGGMTASVAGRYLGTRLAGALSTRDAAQRRLATTHERAGSRIARTLGELKGPVMKLGQLASVSSGLLPMELASKLEGLRKDAPPVPYEVIAGQIEAELGEPPERLFARFDHEPFAAASIGQVHRAVMDDGREVVVKVQYPGIDGTVDADMAQLRLTLRAIGILGTRRTMFNRFLEEVSAHVREELDYCLEADNVRLLAQFHRPRHDFVHIPDVVGERSSQRVLTLTYEGGEPIAAASLYPQAIRDRIGDRLVELMYAEIFELGALHGDPNPANFAFRRDGTFALYDFGCIKRFTPEELSGIRDILNGAITADYDTIERGLVTIGARNLNGPPVDLTLYEAFRSLLAPALDSDEPFDVAAAVLHRRAPALLPHLRQELGSFDVPTGLLLLQRVNVGYYGNLRQLGARVHLRQIIEKALARSGSRHDAGRS